MKPTFFSLFILLLLQCSDSPQHTNEIHALQKCQTNSKAHFRGIKAVTDKLVWLSGTQGTVLNTTDGGNTWNDVSVPNCKELDFRDIHALDDKRAWVMSSGNGVKIYHTSDAGKTWNLQFEDTSKVVFFDGMDFYDEKKGMAYGDPINGVMDVLKTTNGGQTWVRSEEEKLPQALEGEAGFAASGTGIVHHGEHIWMATGGAEISRIIKSSDYGNSWEAAVTPIKGGEGAGVFSMAFKDELNGVVVGGNYLDSTSVKFNCAYTVDGGNSWDLVEENGPGGYRSCVAITPSGIAVACGRTGIDKSSDFKKWEAVSNEGYFTCDVGRKTIWLAGRNGKVGRLNL